MLSCFDQAYQEYRGVEIFTFNYQLFEISWTSVCSSHLELMPTSKLDHDWATCFPSAPELSTIISASFSGFSPPLCPQPPGPHFNYPSVHLDCMKGCWLKHIVVCTAHSWNFIPSYLKRKKVVRRSHSYTVVLLRTKSHDCLISAAQRMVVWYIIKFPWINMFDVIW